MPRLPEGTGEAENMRRGIAAVTERMDGGRRACPAVGGSSINYPSIPSHPSIHPSILNSGLLLHSDSGPSGLTDERQQRRRDPTGRVEKTEEQREPGATWKDAVGSPHGSPGRRTIQPPAIGTAAIKKKKGRREVPTGFYSISGGRFTVPSVEL